MANPTNSSKATWYTRCLAVRPTIRPSKFSTSGSCDSHRPDGSPVAQSAVTLTNNSEPEPDFVFARGDESTFRTHHPGPADIGLVVEVSNSSLAIDRDDKGSIYAANGIPVYWVVNVVDKVIEVYTWPAGTGDTAAYAKRDDCAVGASVPVVLDGNTIGTIAVSDVMGNSAASHFFWCGIRLP